MNNEPDNLQTEWLKLLQFSGIDSGQADFPSAAKCRILELFGDSARAKRADGGNAAIPRRAVVAGFFYRDIDGNGAFEPGEELPATLLGDPVLLQDGAPLEGAAALYFNCYWFDPIELGEAKDKQPLEIRFAPDGIEPVLCTIPAKPGLNICHLAVEPVKPLVYLVPHSHYDTEWVYTHEECLRRVEIPNIEERLDLLEKEPAHCFCMDEECVTWPFVERIDAKYFEMLHRGMMEGSIEPKGIITQQELTLPYGESIVRAITMGEVMLSDLMGETIRPDVFWSVDQYGLGGQIPQILAKAGRPYFLMGEYVGEYYGAMTEFRRIPFSNPEVKATPQLWLEGMDGTRVLVHRSQYSLFEDIVPPPVKPDLPHNSTLVFQGGDNVAPMKELTQRVKSLNEQNGPYKYIITLSPSFFNTIESDGGIPVMSTESFVTYWSGIYESRVVGRLQNRKLENSILGVEAMATCAHVEGMSYPKALFDGWYHMLLNQHHDPLMTPMATPNLFDNAMPARYEAALANIEAARTSVTSWLGVDIVTNEADGDPLIAFNPNASVRSAVVEASVAERGMTGAANGAGGHGSITVRDGTGREVPAQVIERSEDAGQIAFLAEDLPAMGWRTYYATYGAATSGEESGAGSGTGTSSAVSADETHIENEVIRIELAQGVIKKVIEKNTGTTVMQADDQAGINEVLIWKDEGCISIPRPVDSNDIVHFIDNPKAELVGRSGEAGSIEVQVMETGPVRAKIRINFELDLGTFCQDVSLESGSPIIHFSTEIKWRPDGKNDVSKIDEYNGRRLRVAFNTAYQNADVFCDIPYGVIEWQQSETIRPINSWLEVDSDKTGLAFCHSGPPSIQAVKDVVYMTLIRSVTEPHYDKDDEKQCYWDNAEDEAREAGRHRIGYSVYIHPGNWEKAHTPRVVSRINSPVFVKATNRHTGIKGPLLKGEQSYLSLEPEDLVVTAFKAPEYADSGTIVRFFNPTAGKLSGSLRIGFKHKNVEKIDFRERHLAQIKGENPYTIEVGPHEIVAVRIY